MRRPGPALTISFGLGPPRAHEDNVDEDHLGREHDDGDQDLIREGVIAILHSMRDRGEPAIKGVHALADALREMAEAVQAGNHRRLEEAAADACDAIHAIGGDEDEQRTLMGRRRRNSLATDLR
jgi:hypothetical protein